MIHDYLRYVSLLLLAGALAACQTPAVRAPDDGVPRTQVRIAEGLLGGTSHTAGTYAWLGIPYAQPPVGALRWRAPQPVDPWEGILAATQFGSPCVQFPNFTVQQTASAPRITVGSEDCLTLNVFAPGKIATGEGKLPVMVWIHGGGNTSGSAEAYDGGPLASSQGVVVVTLNYRLGLFGFLRHPGLRTADYTAEEASGNYAILDIITALRWVQNNIAAFGGDAGNVTVFGESAGGRNTWGLVQTPLASGLFHKAIIQSGSLRLMDPVKSESISPDAPDYTSYRNNTAEVLDRILPAHRSLGATDTVNTLRAMDAEAIYAGIELNGAGSHRQPRLFLDGYMFTRPALEVLQDPAAYNAVPIITGANRDEDKLFMQYDPQWVQTRFGFLRKVREPERYNNAAQYAANYWRVLTVDEPARVIAANGGPPVYAYRFDFDNHMNWPVNLTELAGAAHAFEIPFVFGLHNEAPWKNIFRAKEERGVLSATMMDYWGGFAHTGKPGNGLSGGQPTWQRWKQGREQLMVFDIESDGGVRMSQSPLRVAEIKHRLAVDELLSQQEKCRAYRSLFLNGYQTEDFYSEAEYRGFGGGSCPP